MPSSRSASGRRPDPVRNSALSCGPPCISRRRPIPDSFRPSTDDRRSTRTITFGRGTLKASTAEKGLTSTAAPAPSHREVFRLGMGHDDRRGRLLGVELVLLGEGDADLLGVEQQEESALVLGSYSEPVPRWLAAPGKCALLILKLLPNCRHRDT